MKKIILGVTAAVLVCIILSVMAMAMTIEPIPASMETVATPDEPIATPDEIITVVATEPVEATVVVETVPEEAEKLEETAPSESEKEETKVDKNKDKKKKPNLNKKPANETATPDTPSKDKVERVYLGEYKLTAYCPCYGCSEGYEDNTATGVKAKQGRTIAVDPRVIPYGSKVEINGKIYIAEDCGGAIKGKRIDVYFKSHKEANKFGIQYAKVYLVK